MNQRAVLRKRIFNSGNTKTGL